MKNYLHLLLLLASANFYGHNLENCGLDNNPALTDDEAAFLNAYFGENESEGFDFKGKKVLIVNGAQGLRFESKAEYFKDIKQRLEQSGLPVATTPIPLTQMEKIQSGGYDAVITHWVDEPMTKEKKRNIIARLASGFWETLNN
ncbi:hypothetical protein R1T16_12925 [Flavobacterium sp. DG1-102-2]|uniref:hypothetical protein n=1 Tax=Flavobacterium sp. DG1-102-2 TaxID=3081663 RepID=UPI002949E669|nr:hypothetical protein [Flavobacterium sp. DG1-102-2]MDV6169332.1 hypothetical protein [Flavobacterium sp. DG1-102-2]